MLDSTIPLAAQLHFLNLFGPASAGPGTGLGGAGAAATGSAVYEGLHRLLHYGVAPAFEAYVESKARRGDAGRGLEDGKDTDAKMGIPVTKKKFAELELSLLHRTCSTVCFYSTANSPAHQETADPTFREVQFSRMSRSPTSFSRSTRPSRPPSPKPRVPVSNRAPT